MRLLSLLTAAASEAGTSERSLWKKLLILPSSSERTDMQDTLTSKSCSDLLSLFASEAPVPGGGGAAALTGALGVALCSMVVNLTIGRKKYAVFEKDLERIRKKASSLEEKLLLLVDKDAEAFEPLSEAYAIPKNEPGRDKLIESAALSACETPLEMMKVICSAIELTEELQDKGNVMLVSDVGWARPCLPPLWKAHP